MRSAQRAQLALLLEVAATPTPGSVDRHRDHPGLRFEHFLAGAVGAADGLAAAAGDEPLGAAFERAVAGMAAAQTAGNTQFGALLLLCPLVRTAAADALTPEGVTDVVAGTTVSDAAAFCRAFDAVDVAVGEPPPDLADLDVRDPDAAARAVEDRGLTLADVMERSAPTDGVAREWTTGFERTFGAAQALLGREGTVLERAASVYLELLAEGPDDFVTKRHGESAAEGVAERARSARDGALDPEALADALVDEGLNPGTTADLLAAGLYVALERGLVV